MAREYPPFGPFTISSVPLLFLRSEINGGRPASSGIVPHANSEAQNDEADRIAVDGPEDGGNSPCRSPSVGGGHPQGQGPIGPKGQIAAAGERRAAK